MHYQICESKSAKELQAEVNRLIGKGWRPCGGITASCSQSSGAWWYYQAMIIPRDEFVGDAAYDRGSILGDPDFA